MKRLITLTLMFTVVFCTSCKEKPDDGEGGGDDTIVPQKPQGYVIGSYYSKNDVEGIVYKVNADGDKGMIVSLNEGMKQWYDKTPREFTGAGDRDNGANNMSIIVGFGFLVDYPAFDWCNSQNKGNTSGWYLPAENEIYDVARVYEQLQDSLEAHAGTRFSTGKYWSSTDNDNGTGGICQDASAVDFGNTSLPFSSVSKAQTCKVRAVRAF